MLLNLAKNFKPVVKIFFRAFSSVGRAAALQAAGRRFESVNAHHVEVVVM